MVTPGPMYSDAARRCADIVTLATLAGHVGDWVAIRLSDGGSDGAHYPSKGVATRHQLHESQCTYVKVPPDGMTPRSAEVVLSFYRRAYEAGFRQSDPDAHTSIPLTAKWLPRR